jgi:hypothetical protein
VSAYAYIGILYLSAGVYVHYVFNGILYLSAKVLFIGIFLSASEFHSMQGPLGNGLQCHRQRLRRAADVPSIPGSLAESIPLVNAFVDSSVGPKVS